MSDVEIADVDDIDDLTDEEIAAMVKHVSEAVLKQPPIAWNRKLCLTLKSPTSKN